uniref:Zinc finger ZPR1-type domain-containing protein n=1 Tax=Acrobeloides nanus TaxID=290746 RepID=A0A914EBW4_9BILA
MLVSFECEHCGLRNNELQSGEPVQEFGTEIVLRVKDPRDLNRQLIKSEYASIEIPELELVIPHKSQPGEITTVEGVLQHVKNGLEQDQDRRREQERETAEQIDKFIGRLDKLINLEEPFTLKLNDPSGNCYIENPDPLHVDPHCITSHYYRKLDENKLLGLASDDTIEENPADVAEREWKSYEDVKNEILHFPAACSECGAPTDTLMKPTDIPYFQTVIVMSTNCDRCGYKNNEVKSGGSFQDHGCKLSIKIEEPIDLSRDILKSDTCSVALPELDIESGGGALAGRFTTVEGLLTATRDQLKEQSQIFMGDSADGSTKNRIEEVLNQIDEVVALKRKCTLVLDDPAGNSYIQSLTAPMDDPRLTKEFYTRSYEQNDELGINDMKVENYGPLGEIEEEDEEVNI